MPCLRFGTILEKKMKQLEKKLRELQKDGYENIGINQVLQWMAEIKRDNRFKRVLSTHRLLHKTEKRHV
jgi:hypothetical protein